MPMNASEFQKEYAAVNFEENEGKCEPTFTSLLGCEITSDDRIRRRNTPSLASDGSALGPFAAP